MKKTKNRVLAIVLTVALVFSIGAVGAVALTSVLGSKNVTTAADGSAVINANSVEEAIEIIKTNPEILAPAADETEEEFFPAESKSYDAAPKKTVPTIILPGISQSDSYLADENGNPVVNGNGDELGGGLLIIDESTLVPVLLKDLLVPLSSSLIYQKDNGLSEAVYQTVKDVFTIQASDKNGNPVNNLLTVEYRDENGIPQSVDDMSQEDRDYFYRMIPMNEIVNMGLVKQDDLYLYTFPLISDPMNSAKNLDAYIQEVKEKEGVDSVNIATISLGGTILTAYLDLKKDTGYEDINKIVNVVSCLQGTDVMGDFYLRNFNLEDEFLFHEYIPMIFEESEGFETYGHLINIALKIFPREVVEHILTAAVDGILDTLMLNCPQFWSMVPVDKYDEVMAKYDFIATDPEYAELYAKLEAFHTAAVNLKDNLTKFNTDKKSVFNLCGYDLDYSAQDYCFFAAMKSSLTTNSDAIIDIDSTSLGATYAPAGTTLDDDVIDAVDPDFKYLSPEGSIDAATCLFPDNVWFFHGQHHEVGRNDVVIKLVGQIIAGNIESTDDMSDSYPQFNGNRNTKDIFRWYFDEAETVFEEYEADSTAYAEADIAELMDAYAEGKSLLTDTICEPSVAEAVKERFKNALARVGQEGAPKDETLDKAIETVATFVDDTIYEIFGGYGFSDAFNITLPFLSKIK